LQRNIEAEKGAAYHLCKAPEEAITTMLNMGFTADCFTTKPLQELFGCVIECVGRGIVERRGIAAELEHRGKITNPENLKRVQQALIGIPPEPDIQLEQAVRLLIATRAYNQSQEITTSFFNKTSPNRIHSDLPGLIDLLLHVNTRTAANDAIPSVILEQIRNGSYGYISTGYKEWDELLRPPNYLGTGGVGLGQLGVLGMPSGHGKSTTGCNLACNFARQGLGTIYFAMEMGRERTLLWILCNLANLPESAVLKPSGEEEIETVKATEKLADSWIRIYSGHHTISGMSARVMAHQREFGPIGLVVIDRFRDIIDEDAWGRKSAGWDLLDAKAGALLQMSQETNTHTFALNQLTDIAKSNWENGMQVKSANLLRGGQSLGNAADVITAGGRHTGNEDYIYDPNKENVVRFHVKKVRDRGVDIGAFELKFNPKYHRLEEVT